MNEQILHVYIYKVCSVGFLNVWPGKVNVYIHIYIYMFCSPTKQYFRSLFFNFSDFFGITLSLALNCSRKTENQDLSTLRFET